MDKRLFTVVSGDLQHSRQVQDRPALGGRIQETLRRIAQQYATDLYAPPSLSRGIDEMSAVLESPCSAYRVCSAVNDALHPYFFRFAIVQGVLDVNLDSRDASMMDGPAFHDAADLLEDAKARDRTYLFSLGFRDSTVGDLLNSLANTLAVLKRRRTQRQQLVANLYGALGTQRAVAEEMAMTPQAVSDALRAANWPEVRQAEEVLNAALADSTLYGPETRSEPPHAEE